MLRRISCVPRITGLARVTPRWSAARLLPLRPLSDDHEVFEDIEYDYTNKLYFKNHAPQVGKSFANGQECSSRISSP